MEVSPEFLMATQIRKDIVQFTDDLAYRGHSDVLTDYPTEYLKIVEQYLNLPITGDLTQLIINYKRNYYTKNCLDFHSPDVCFVGAARYGDIDNLKLIRPKLTYKYEQKLTEEVLKIAAKNGRIEAVKFLIRKIHDRNIKGEVLIQAVENGQLEMVELLARDINDKTVIGRALVTAAGNNQLNIVDFLKNETSSEYFSLAREIAAENGYFEIVDSLFRVAHYISNPITTDEVKYILGKAIQYRNMRAIKYLKENVKISRHEFNRAFYSEIIKASEKGDLDLLKELLSISPEYVSVLVSEMSKIGNLDMVKFLLETYFDTSIWENNRKINLSEIALTAAANNGNINILQYILTLPNVKNKFGNPKRASKITLNDVLKEAIKNKRLDVIQYLLTSDQKLPDGIRDTFIIATENDQSEILNWLFQFISPEDLNTGLNEALIFAINNDKHKVIQTLAAMGRANNLASVADYFLKTKDIFRIRILAKNTGAVSGSKEDLFVWAAAIGSVSLIAYLVENGVDPNYSDRLALYAAESYEQSSTAEYLVNLYNELDRIH